MGNIKLYHGSQKIIKEPMYGHRKAYNDYGRGFYCTEHIELAKEWACTESSSGYVNEYQLDLAGLRILDLSSPMYNILHWLALLVEYRGIHWSTPVMRRGAEWLKEHYLLDLSRYDIVIGYRADDSYFSFARAFLNNQISYKQLSHAMKLGKMGEQIVLKSEKAFAALRFWDYELADNTTYYLKRRTRDEQARQAFLQMLEEEDMDGLFMRDIIREEVMPNDPQLR